jgi:acetyltransferase-like isoleucine patch superfamily enzyme
MERTNMKLLGWPLVTAQRLARGLRRRIRTFAYRQMLGAMGKGCHICDGVVIYGPQHISLGDGVVLNDGALLQVYDGNAGITIGDRVTISYRACILTVGLDLDVGLENHAHAGGPVLIEPGAWIGAYAVVLPGVTVGRGAVVGAGSVVTHDVPPHTVVAGTPARAIRTLEEPQP